MKQRASCSCLCTDLPWGMIQELHHLAWPESFECSPSSLYKGASSRLHGNRTVQVDKLHPSLRKKRQDSELTKHITIVLE